MNSKDSFQESPIRLVAPDDAADFEGLSLAELQEIDLDPAIHVVVEWTDATTSTDLGPIFRTYTYSVTGDDESDDPSNPETVWSATCAEIETVTAKGDTPGAAIDHLLAWLAEVILPSCVQAYGKVPASQMLV